MSAVPIYTLNKLGTVTINKSGIESIFAKLDNSKPIAIISVFGDFRQDNGTNSESFSDWLKNKNLDGFKYAGGDTGVTNGISIWSEPFLISSGNKELYVLLMDSQGLCDNAQMENADKAIFGLTTMLSSFQIFNISKQMNTMIFDYASGLSQFVKEYQKINDSKPFQELSFLLRDYPNFEDRSNIELCCHQGRERLSEYMNETQSREARAVQNTINDMYRSSGSFCLPHPGNNIDCKYPSKRACDIDEFFLQMVSVYIKTVCDSVVPLRVQGKELTANEFKEYMLQICNAFSNPRHFPSSDDLQTIQRIFKVMDVKRECVVRAEQRLWDSFYFGKKYVKPEELEKAFTQANKDMNESFQKEYPDSNDYVARVKAEMQDELHSYYDQVKSANSGIIPKIQYGPRVIIGLFGHKRKRPVYPELKDIPPRPK